jgi:hypothetical protein
MKIDAVADPGEKVAVPLSAAGPALAAPTL